MDLPTEYDGKPIVLDNKSGRNTIIKEQKIQEIKKTIKEQIENHENADMKKKWSKMSEKDFLMKKKKKE